MTDIEHTAFKEWVDEQHTQTDAAEIVKVSRGSLVDIYTKGSGKPGNIKRIRRLIKDKLVEIKMRTAA